MKNIIYLLAAFLLLSCATPEQRAEKHSVTLEIQASAHKVRVVMPNANDWCEVEKTCRYIKNNKCGGISNEKCIQDFRLDALKLGADTVVIQKFQDYVARPGQIYAYAQMYSCEDKFTVLGHRYQAVSPTRLLRTRYISNEYAKKCKLNQTCKKLEPFLCVNTTDNPARECLRTLDRRYNDIVAVNTLVFKKETFELLDTNGRYLSGNYEVSGDGLKCPL